MDYDDTKKPSKADVRESGVIMEHSQISLNPQIENHTSESDFNYQAKNIPPKSVNESAFKFVIDDSENPIQKNTPHIEIVTNISDKKPNKPSFFKKVEHASNSLSKALTQKFRKSSAKLASVKQSKDYETNTLDSDNANNAIQSRTNESSEKDFKANLRRKPKANLPLDRSRFKALSSSHATDKSQDNSIAPSHTLFSGVNYEIIVANQTAAAPAKPPPKGGDKLYEEDMSTCIQKPARTKSQTGIDTKAKLDVKTKKGSGADLTAKGSATKGSSSAANAKGGTRK